MNIHKNNKAFTLIEVTLVVGIISLLTGIVISNTTDAKQKAEDVHMITEAKQVENALALYKDKYGNMPTVNGYTGVMLSENDSDSNKKTAYQNSMGILVTEGLLPSVPTSPSGTAYAYLVTTDGQSAVFAASTNNNRNSSGSGSGSNSCDAVNELKEYESCSDYGSEYNCNSSEITSELTGGNIDCFYIDSEDDLSYCDLYSSTSNDFPSIICEANVQIIPGSCGTPGCTPPPDQYVIDYSGQPSLYLCPYTTTDPVCSGASDSDYCTCVE